MSDKEKTRQTLSLALRDPAAVGQKIDPPYFFGVHEIWTEQLPDPFASPGWIDHCEVSAKMLGVRSLETDKKKFSLKRMAKKFLRGGDIPSHLSIPLRLIKKTISDSHKIKILDVGGGYGDNYHLLRNELSAHAGQLTFTVVDNKRSCLLGEQLFSSSDEVSFRDTMPDEYYDLILVIGTLQYIRDWREFLSELARRKPKFVFVARTPIRVDGPSFLTMQSICPAFGFEALTKVGEANVSVLSAEELQEIMLFNGYLLKEKRFNSDYSKNFSRLPKQYQKVVYVDWLWEQSATS